MKTPRVVRLDIQPAMALVAQDYLYPYCVACAFDCSDSWDTAKAQEHIWDYLNARLPASQRAKSILEYIQAHPTLQPQIVLTLEKVKDAHGEVESFASDYFGLSA